MIQPNSFQRMPPGGSGNGGVGVAAGAVDTSPINNNNNNNNSTLQSPFWENQRQLLQTSRSTSSPHNYARSAALNSRNNNTNSATTTVLELAQQFVLQQQQPSSVVAAAAAASATNNSSSGGPGTPIKGTAKVTNGFPNNQTQKFMKEQQEEERQRRINEDINKQYWTAIDMSGQGLLCVNPKLFNYNFLQKLYLSHNNLTEIPKSITKLSQLKVLDLSDNALTELPDELGLMFSLKYLFLFDNKLTDLPHEFGYLFQLEMLGIDGNPLPENINQQMNNEGTRGVIIELREKAPIKYKDPGRSWHVFPTDQQYESQEKFSIMTYNTLCDKYATAQMYGYTPSWVLSWDYRSKLLLQEITGYESDIISLQEVDQESFETYWTPELEKRGYKGVHLQKTRAKRMGEGESKYVDGCAMFYKTDMFKLVDKQKCEYNVLTSSRMKDSKNAEDMINRVMSKDEVALICVFEHIPTGNVLVAANTHVQWNPVFKDVKLIQTKLLLDVTEEICKKLSPKYQIKDYKNIPVVLCCDLNSTVDSGACQLLSTGKVASNHSDLEGRNYGTFTKDGLSHSLSLKSAYSEIGELPFTNYTPNFVDAIDYLYYTSPSLAVCELLGEIDREYAGHYIGFPNTDHPSDHIPLMSKFAFKKIKEPSAKPPPPNFGK